VHGAVLTEALASRFGVQIQVATFTDRGHRNWVSDLRRCAAYMLATEDR
jgi:hypothetical protein